MQTHTLQECKIREVWKNGDMATSCELERCRILQRECGRKRQHKRDQGGKRRKRTDESAEGTRHAATGASEASGDKASLPVMPGWRRWKKGW